MTDWSTYKFHASSIGKIMTESRTKEPLGETCKTHLLECWIKETYGREKDITNKYIEKGLAVEEDAITLYSLNTKKFWKKNIETLENDFIVGTPDLYDGEAIKNATAIKDIKSSWDLFTYFANFVKPINKDYAWQLSSYCALTGAESAGLVYCLVNTPQELIWKAKDRLKWDMGIIDPSASTVYQMACDAIDKDMTYDDIPREHRHVEFEIDITKYPIEAAYERIELCRTFLSKLKLQPEMKKEITGA